MDAGLANSISPSPASQPTLQTHLEVGGQEKLEFGDRSQKLGLLFSLLWKSFHPAPFFPPQKPRWASAHVAPHLGDLKSQDIAGFWGPALSLPSWIAQGKLVNLSGPQFL